MLSTVNRHPHHLGTSVPERGGRHIYMGAAQIHMQFDSGWRVRVPFNGFKVNMQEEDKAP